MMAIARVIMAKVPFITGGMLYISVTTNPVEVFFDDFEVVHTKGPVVQSEEYYPFGLTFNSYVRENNINQNYLYNGKERQDELSLGWLDHGARMYDPGISRWGNPDPMTDMYRPWSPYNYVLNNPIRLIDPDGMD